jgi:hypothetical protein
MEWWQSQRRLEYFPSLLSSSPLRFETEFFLLVAESFDLSFPFSPLLARQASLRMAGARSLQGKLVEIIQKEKTAMGRGCYSFSLYSALPSASQTVLLHYTCER